MNKYDIQRVVGQGSYGRAILCKRKADSKLCIIKQISLTKLSRHEAKMTEQEAALLHKLQHPNIVAFWESFVANANLHIVMEFADGGDLESYIKNHIRQNRGREIPETRVLDLFVQLCLAIKHIHDRKILHRDLKCQNVFLTSKGICKLGDFGVSRVLRSTVELAATQIGTPYYMSPEIMNNQKYGSKTDIWSLGIILYELVCLRLPFQGNSMKQLCYNIINTTPASPSSVYSKEMRELVRDILAKDPRKRPSVNNILARSLIKSRIQNFLNETKIHREFCHTVLHGMNVLQSSPGKDAVPVPNRIAAAPAVAPRPVIPAAPVAAPRPVIAAAPAAAPRPVIAAPPAVRPVVNAAPPSRPVVKVVPPAPWKPTVPQSVAAAAPAAALIRAPSAPSFPQRPANAAPPLQRQASANSNLADPRNAAPLVRAPSAGLPSRREEPKAAPVVKAPAPVVADRRVSSDAPKRVQDIISNMMRPPALMNPNPPSNNNFNNYNNNGNARAVPAPAANYLAMREAARAMDVRPKPSNAAPVPSPRLNANDPAAKKVERRPDSAPSKHAEEKAVSPFEAVVGKAIRPQSAQSRPSSAQPAVVLSRAAPAPPPVEHRVANAAAPVAAKRVEAPVVAVKNPSNGQRQPFQFADRMKEINEAMGKAAAVIDVVKQEKEKLADRRSPYPSSAASDAKAAPAPAPVPAPRAAVVASRRQSDPPKPSKASPVVEDSWLSNLQQQMGALKMQVQQIQAAKTPQMASDASRDSPVGFPVDNSNQRQRVAAAAAMRNNSNPNNAAPSNSNKGRERQSFPLPSAAAAPVSHNREEVAPQPQSAGSNKAAAPAAKAPAPLLRQRSQNSVSPAPSAAAGKVVVLPNRRISEPMPQQQLRLSINEPKAPPKKKPTPAPVSKEALEQRKEMREKHRSDLRKFLKEQREAKSVWHGMDDEDDDLASTPRLNIVDPHTHLTPDVKDHDKRRRSSGHSLNEELRHLHDEERENLRRLIQEKRKGFTPQRSQAESEVVVLVNKDYAEVAGKFQAAAADLVRAADSKNNNTSPEKSPVSAEEVSLPSQSVDLLEQSAFNLDEDEVFLTANDDLGQSFLAQIQDNPEFNALDPEAALEYSMMCEQMQQILQLPSRHHPAMDMVMDRIGEGTDGEEVEGEEEEIEEGFEEESIKLTVSESEDESDDRFLPLEDDFNEEEVMVMPPADPEDDLLSDDLYITESDPFKSTVANLTRSLSQAAGENQPTIENPVEAEKEKKYIGDLKKQLMKEMGPVKLEKALELLGTQLVDESADDDQLLNSLEEIIGADNLQYLEDLYQIVTYQLS